MGLTKDYQRFLPAGFCNVVHSTNGVVQSVDKVRVATSACECVNIYNLRTGEIIDQIRRENHQVNVFKFSPDKRFLAIGYDDGEVHVYNQTKRETKDTVVFAGHKRGVNTLAFSNDGNTLATGGKDSVIILWDILNETGKFRLNGHTNSITQLQFTRDDKHLISSSKDTQVRFWDLSTHGCFYTISDSLSEVYGFALIKDDRLLVVGSAEVEMAVYELTWLDRLTEEEAAEEAEAEKQEKKKQKLTTEALVGAELLDGDRDQGNVVIRTKKRGALLRQAKGRALQLAVSPDETIICVLGGDTVMDVFRVYSDEEAKRRFSKKLRKAKRKNEATYEGTEITEEDVSKDVTLLIARCGDYRSAAKLKWIDFVKIIYKKGETGREYRIVGIHNNNSLHGISITVDLKTNEVESESLTNLDRRGHRAEVRCLAMSANENCFVSGAADGAILWDLETLLPKNKLEVENITELTAALFVPGDKHVVFGSKTGTIYIFDLATCELVRDYQNAHNGPIWGLVGLPDQTGFVSVGSDKQAHFWEYQMVSEVATRTLRLNNNRSHELEDEIMCVTISPNGKFIIFGLLNFTAKVHYLDSFKFFLSLYGHSLPVMCVDVDNESKLAVTGSSDKGCKVWGLDFGDCHKSLFGHSDAVTAVKFDNSREEKLFFSAGKDGKIIQWDAVKFHKVQVLEGHSAEIRALISNRNVTTLITASHDKSIRLWEVSEELVILSEQETAEMEKDFEDKMVDAEDIVPGEEREPEAELAAKKSVETIKGTEAILEAVDIFRAERIAGTKVDLTNINQLHPLIKAYNSTSLEHFVLDAICRVPPSHLEKSLLMVPFNYVAEICKALSTCIEERYRVETATRVVLFLMKIHHNYVVRSIDMFPMIDELRTRVPVELGHAQSLVGFNAAALRLLKLQLEERDNIQMFKDISKIDAATKGKRHRKRERTALIRTLN
uniref:Utp12 domain-containing protein n=1 Tax=Panagrellus redivivus TaxID=6233 RepID=A0A7E4W877_PANRE